MWKSYISTSGSRTLYLQCGKYLLLGDDDDRKYILKRAWSTNAQLLALGELHHGPEKIREFPGSTVVLRLK